MTYTPSVADEILGLMGGVGQVTAKKMFGALGFYHGPKLFACLMSDDVFYLKAQGAFADELKALGQKPFLYEGKSGRKVAMPYMTAPQSCLEDAEEMAAWCKKALAAMPAKTASKNKPTSAPKRNSSTKKG